MLGCFSEFYCLVAKGSRINLLKKTYNVRCDYFLVHDFQRNIHGKGILQKNDKLRFVIKGKGKINVFESNLDEYYFIHSDFIDVKTRGVCLEFDKNKKIGEVKELFFDKDLNVKSNIQFITSASAQNSCLPYFRCYIKSFSNLEGCWELKLEEI